MDFRLRMNVLNLASLLVLAQLFIVVYGDTKTDQCFDDAIDKYICEDGDDQYTCDCGDEMECYFQLVIEHRTSYTVFAKSSKRSTKRVVPVESTGFGKFALKKKRCSSVFNKDLYSTLNSVDGTENRTFIAVNGRFQGPTLIMRENATVVVDVFNELESENISIHWHGMHQNNTAWMDGVGLITQWPIQAGGGRFRYIFKAKPFGSFWYHSHMDEQRVDGLFGALIVKEDRIPPEFEKFEFEDKPGEHSIAILDFSRYSASNITESMTKGRIPNSVKGDLEKGRQEFQTSCSPDGAKISGLLPFNSILINGLGYNKGLDFNKAAISAFYVEPLKTYRFRLIGAQATLAVSFSVDQHNLTVIGTDGYFVEPFVTDYIIIHSGERYDFLLTANSTDAAITQFVMRTESLEVNCETGEHLPNSGLAYLAYGNNSDDVHVNVTHLYNEFNKTNPRDCNADRPCTVLNCPFKTYPNAPQFDCHHVDKLKLLELSEDFLPDSANIDLDRTMFFSFRRNFSAGGAYINEQQLKLPSMPLQGQNYSEILGPEICEYNDSTCPIDAYKERCIHIAEISEDYYLNSFRFVLTSVDIDNSLFTHPIHLHGHSFHVVKVGYPEYYPDGTVKNQSQDLKIACNGVPYWVNQPNITIDQHTVRKDTIMIPAGGYVVIDFFADNPGYWFMHCHIDGHLVDGMGIAIRELKEKQQEPPEGLTEDNKDFCWTVEEFESITSIKESERNLIKQEKLPTCGKEADWNANEKVVKKNILTSKREKSKFEKEMHRPFKNRDAVVEDFLEKLKLMNDASGPSKDQVYDNYSEKKEVSLKERELKHMESFLPFRDRPAARRSEQPRMSAYLRERSFHSKGMGLPRNKQSSLYT